MKRRRIDVDAKIALHENQIRPLARFDRTDHVRRLQVARAVQGRHLHGLFDGQARLDQELETQLRREGWKVNHKLVQRLYQEEELSLRRKRPKRRRMAIQREQAPQTTRPNERWAMDFMHESLASGQTVRVFAAVDVHTRTGRLRGRCSRHPWPSEAREVAFQLNQIWVSDQVE